MPSDDEIKSLIEAEGEHAELTRDDPLPRDAIATRPNRAESTVYPIRLGNDTIAELDELAAARDVPGSAMVRGFILDGIKAIREAPSYTVAVTEWRPGWRMRWRRMWGLEIAGEGVTQSYPNFADAEMMVRDYLNLLHDDTRGDDANIRFRRG